MYYFPDSPRQQKQRRTLVAEIRRKGIADERVLEAIGRVPRHLFMSAGYSEDAYVDSAFPIGEGQTISQPYTVAYQTALLQVEPGQRVLEIGSGSGYQAAVLGAMGAAVYSVERIAALYHRLATQPWRPLYPDVHFYYGDGNEGLPQEAPFDRVLITAAAPDWSDVLLEQLLPGGCLVLPFDNGGAHQQMLRLWKEEGGVRREAFGFFSFVPLRRGVE
ncbi:protein-L-isoaspartate(D-aspartate) O-methyltransferase [Flaviaesturariibacter amylovorans]|uniref:Protein-L-isoaspartate O-methyltransferase n=1 Tax=Flaviaesturariibacter amylovorans TaxID=1084520 RepID=A0ABP8GZG7_9BACT